ncbi:MAG: potassium/proton antiporter [Nitrospirota bacterium]
MTIHAVLTIGPWLLLLGVVLTKLSRRLNVPALLFFMVVGMVAGSEGLGGIAFENYQLTQDVGLVALALILFAGGLDTGPRAFSLGVRPATSLATLGVLFTAVALGAFAAWWMGWSLLEGILLGSIVGSTDVAAVFLVLRSQNTKLPRPVESALEVESGMNDPMAVFMTIAVTEVLTTGRGLSLADILAELGYQAVSGTVIGLTFGMAGAWAINRIRLESSGLYPVMTLAIGLGTFSFTNAVGGSGFMAVYLAGLTIGQRVTVSQRLILDFHDGLAWLMQIVMFVALGLLSFPSRLWAVADQGLMLSAFLILVARPAAVFLSLVVTRFTVRERLLISWVGLRGAVPIILATFPVLAGLPNGPAFFDLIFFVVVTSVLLQGTTISWAARALGLHSHRRPEPRHRLHITSIEQTDRRIVDYYLDQRSPAVGRLIKDLSFPPETFIAMVVRAGQVLAPRGHTCLEVADHVFVLVRKRDQPEITRLFEDTAGPVSADAPTRQ